MSIKEQFNLNYLIQRSPGIAPIYIVLSGLEFPFPFVKSLEIKKMKVKINLLNNPVRLL